jgi:hypothetical protein
MSGTRGAPAPSPGWTDSQGRRAGDVYTDKYGRRRVVAPDEFHADDGTILYGDEARAAGLAHWGFARPRAVRATTPTRTRARTRESRRDQRRTRRTASSTSGGDDDSGPSAEPPSLPYRIAGPAGDSRGVEAAFLKILTDRHGQTWRIAGGES